MRIPFDALAVKAISAEISAWQDSKVQRIVQVDPWTIVLNLYGGPNLGERGLLLSCHPDFYRCHFVTGRYANDATASPLAAIARSKLDGARLISSLQIEGDRILDLKFEAGDSKFKLICELMGKHSNLVLVDERGRCIGAAKWVGVTKSKRPIQPGQAYFRPPVMGQGGGSPFLARLLAASPPETVANTASPVLSQGNGAYPMSVGALGLSEVSRSSFSLALEQHFDAAEKAATLESLRASLSASLSKALGAREEALEKLQEAEISGNAAGSVQVQGELILAYGHAAPTGSRELEVFDYEGEPITIKLDPNKDFKQNAEAYFLKARKAKDRMASFEDQRTRLSQERADLLGAISELKSALSISKMGELVSLAKKRRWMHAQPEPGLTKDERPYQGNRIRELLGPHGYLVLYGENSESNDFLTSKVGRPNDIWLHVRGATSAHVVIRTNNRPDLVPAEVLLYAAKVAVAQSSSKHSSYVTVDWTLKKYVRKPRGSAVGAVVYTNEKSLNVDRRES